MLTVHQLEITIQAKTPLALDPYCGSALRGAFFRSFWGRFCSNREAPTCYECPLNAACPVSTLVAPLRDESPRGRDVPRPYIITPQYTGKERYEPGETYTFGFSLIGNAAKFYPYVMRALLEMEQNNLGHPLNELQRRRGKFRLHRIDAMHPFTKERVCLWQPGEKYPEKLQLGVTADDVKARARQLSQESLSIHFLSPTRLVADGQVLHQPNLVVLIQRLSERFEQIQQEYGSDQGDESKLGYDWYRSLKQHAEGMILEQDQTRWVDIHGYSTRQQQPIYLSGLIGRATFRGPLIPLQELLIWGELLRVGKHIVKGAGFYQIEI